MHAAKNASRVLHLERMTRGELFMLVAFVVVLGGVGFIAYMESQLTLSLSRTFPRISLSADGLGVFVYTIEGGYLAGVRNRPTSFTLKPTKNVQIVSLNGRPIGGTSGTELTNRWGRVVVVAKVAIEGPITLTAVDIRTGRSVTISQWSTAK